MIYFAISSGIGSNTYLHIGRTTYKLSIDEKNKDGKAVLKQLLLNRHKLFFNLFGLLKPLET